MAFLARNLLFGQEATSASSAEEEIAPTPLPDTRREPCAREGCEKRGTRRRVEAEDARARILGIRAVGTNAAGGAYGASPRKLRRRRNPGRPLPSAYAVRRRRHPGHASARASRPPGRAASQRPPQPGTRRLPTPPLPGARRFPAPSNTGSTPRSFPRCSPCRGRPGSPACRRCGTGGSRSAP